MAVQYNNRLRGKIVMVLPASCPPPPPQCVGYYGELQKQNQSPRHSPGRGGGGGGGGGTSA